MQHLILLDGCCSLFATVDGRVEAVVPMSLFRAEIFNVALKATAPSWVVCYGRPGVPDWPLAGWRRGGQGHQEQDLGAQAEQEAEQEPGELR